METRAVLAAALVACAILTSAACAGSRGNVSDAPSDDETSRSGEAARTPAAETTGPLVPNTERTEMQGSERERGGASDVGAGQMKEKQGKPGKVRKREPATKVVVVKIEGLVYEPSVVEVSQGTTVRWVNRDPAEHTVTSEEGGGPLRSDTFGEGGFFEFTSEKPGEFAYFCEVHPFMKGIVVVVR